MAAGPWTLVNTAPEYIGDGTIDLDTDTFKVALILSAKTPALTDSIYADISGNEHANGNGYTTGGVTVTATWTNVTGTVTLDSDDPAWTASGGSITARSAYLYKVGTANGIVSPIIAYMLLDSTPADVTVTDGNVLTIQMPAGGYFQATTA